MFLGGKIPENIGVRSGKLSPCPASPNCVSSFENIPPISLETDGKASWNRLVEVLLGMKGVKVVREDVTYIHAEFTSSLLGFIDDVEFLLDDENKVLHVRSASRLGYSDFGVNRKRVEKIRKQLQNFNHEPLKN